MQVKPKQIYLRNRDLLRNIHLSKATYTWYIDGDWKTSRYVDYDLITCDEEMYEQCKNQMMLQAINRKRLKSNMRRTSILREEDIDMLDKEDYEQIESRLVLFTGEINDRILQLAKIGHYNRKLYENGKKRVTEVEQSELDKIADEDVVIRVFSYDHIPESPDVKSKKVNKFADTKMKVNFPPYRHYALVDGVTKCVAISHNNGKQFSVTHGKIIEPLALGFMKLCDKIAQSYNWRGYTYTDDMKGQALVQLTSVGLQFNEMFSNNPFAYYTSTINNAFTAIFNEEYGVQRLRDKVLLENNFDPSNTAQLKHEISRSEHWDRVLGKENIEGGEVRHLDVDKINDGDYSDLSASFSDDMYEDEDDPESVIEE